MKCRNAKGDVKTGGSSSSRDQFGSCPEDCPSDIRHVGGAKPDQALVWNVRTCRPDAKGDIPAARTARIRVPMRGTGAEQLVVERKSCNGAGSKEQGSTFHFNLKSNYSLIADFRGISGNLTGSF